MKEAKRDFLPPTLRMADNKSSDDEERPVFTVSVLTAEAAEKTCTALVALEKSWREAGKQAEREDDFARSAFCELYANILYVTICDLQKHLLVLKQSVPSGEVDRAFARPVNPPITQTRKTDPARESEPEFRDLRHRQRMAAFN